MNKKFVCKQCGREIFVEIISNSTIDPETGKVGDFESFAQVYCSENLQHTTGYIFDEESQSLILSEDEE